MRDNRVVSRFSKSISQTTTFWELGLGVFGITVILRGKFGLYGRSKVLEKWSWRSGTQPIIVYSKLFIICMLFISCYSFELDT